MRSHAIWREIERETGADILTQCGLLVLSGGGATAFTHVPGFFANTVAAAQRCGVPHRMYDAPALREAFPAFAVADDAIGYFEPGGGFVRPEAAIRAELALAARHGATLHTHKTARAFEASATGVRVTTDRATYTAGTLIVAAGPWLLTCLSPTSRSAAFIARTKAVVRRGRTDRPVRARPAFPAFIWEAARAAASRVYGFPAIDGPRGGVKVATETYATTTTPDSVARAVTPEEIAAVHADYVAPYFPALSPRCVRATTCLYTVTPDFGFVVDRHPRWRSVIVASPCSGHGFKHSAALGEVLADLALERPSPFDLSAFAWSRFH